VSDDDGVAWVVESIRRVAEEADRSGVRLVVENHAKAFVWTYFDFAQRGEVFLRVVDGLRDTSVKVLFDVANPLVIDEESLPLFEQVLDRIGAVHLSDVRRPGTFEFVPVGTGIAPNAEVLRRLKRSGYDGWIAFEEASRTGKEGFRQAASFARSAWEHA
jgi:sugar phosphate isomerase/epimerase